MSTTDSESGVTWAATIFLFATYFRAIPREIFEASTLDGGGAFRAFFSVGLPMVRNGLVVIFVVNFVAVWGEYLLCLTLVDDEAKRRPKPDSLAHQDKTGDFGEGQQKDRDRNK